MDSAFALSLELQKLSPTIRHLEISSLDASSAFFRYDKDGTTIITTQYARGPSRFFNMSEYFPALEVFRVQPTDQARNVLFNESGLPEEDFPGLPDSLTRLILPKYESFHGDPGLLPPNLQVLGGISLDSLDPSTVGLLPRGLIKIGYMSLNLALEVQALPRTLELSQLHIHWNHDVYQALPPALLQFSIFNIDQSSFSANNTHWASSLPRKMTSLSLPDSISLDVASISRLPQSLTFLGDDIVVDWEDCKIHAMTGSRIPWPPTLTEWDLCDPVSSENCRFAPNTLRITYVGDWNESVSAALPAAEHLHFYSPPLFLPLVFEVPLPPKLTKIHFHRNVPSTSSVLRLLPATLQDLTLRMSLDDTEESYGTSFTLPEGLIYFNVSQWFFAWCSKLPKRLQSLIVGKLLEITKEHVEVEDFARMLPTTLLTVDIGLEDGCDIPVFKGRPFSSLTRLESLWCNFTIPFASHVLRHLPRTLLQLIIPLEEISEEDAPFIPPKLYAFRVVFEFDANHQYIVDNVPPTASDILAWEKTPELEARRKSNLEAARSRALTFPDPRTIISNLNA